ncbi:putative Nitric oxide synthase-interacting protein [Hibiscus syriacus]|uniref:Nitric oxide synthase-interacting protein n=1 Tax=Hibiscus syriacus TaxID=106335 RepID=A0A6A3AAM3_HIBSY|nr:putative Nitric oxide synthase-interacting protein [Hibiscus syriacus]
MERSTPVRKPHTSTADLLTWTEGAEAASSNSGQRSSGRYNQPSDRVSKVLFGGQVTDDEAQSLLNKKPCSGYKMKEMTGSGIFAANGASETAATNSANKTGVRMHQRATNSQISFSVDASVSPKKPTSLPEYKEISGHDLFSSPPEIKPRSLAAAAAESRESKDMVEPVPRSIHTSVKVSNPAGGQTSIGDVPPGSAEKPLSQAKLREMSGNDIFSDGKAESRSFYGGSRKPPGGESSISLV